jgi:creatinine amidohydrolase
VSSVEYLLPVTTTEDERSRGAAVAVLPVGSFEQHGPCLPLITDTAIACTIAREVAAAYPVLLLPPVAISCSHEHAAWPGTVSISARTLHAMIGDIRESLDGQGVRGLVVVNGHGGNYVLANVVQEATAVGGACMALFPSSADWAAARNVAGMATGGHKDMHAGELETSILLHAHPDLVRDGWQETDHVTDQRPDLLTLGMAGYTTSGVIGRPSLASAAKGEAVLASLTGSFRRSLDLLAAS